MAESEEKLKSLLMKVKKESEKVGLKLNIQKTKIMASGPMTSWEIDGETVETVSDFIFLASKITEWRVVPFLIPGNLPDPGIELMSPVFLLHWQANSLPQCHLGRSVRIPGAYLISTGEKTDC